MSLSPNRELVDLLLEAYSPCVNFGVCREAVWDPSQGHIPRGFLGAIGNLKDVELVMLFAEPGHAHGEEDYGDFSNSFDLMMAGVQHTYDCMSAGRDQFHKNVRWFLDQLYPDKSFDEQLRRVWMTEGRLCSVTKEIGGLKDKTCAARYLERQLDLLSNATVVAFGNKAKGYMKGSKRGWIGAYALSPPGANLLPARPSWEKAISQIEERRCSSREH